MEAEQKKILNSLLIPAIVVGILWILWGMSHLFDWQLSSLGIRPRRWEGLWGILTAPWIHAKSYNHLLSNSFPLFVLMAALRYFYRSISWEVLLWAYFITGIWVWTAARASSHIGASGIVYALAAFLFASGVIRKDLRALALALLVSFLYGGMVWGIFPMEEGVSWESHLLGGLSGVVLAYFYRKRGIVAKPQYPWENESEEVSPEYPIWDYRRIPPPEGYSYPPEKPPKPE